MADFKARWSTAFGEKRTSIFLVDVQLNRKSISHFTIGKAPPNVITAIRVAELFCIVYGSLRHCALWSVCGFLRCCWSGVSPIQRRFAHHDGSGRQSGAHRVHSSNCSNHRRHPTQPRRNAKPHRYQPGPCQPLK